MDGDIPTNLVLSLLGLGIPEMAQLILPLSLFLGLLMTLGKLYTESEITVMHACGLSKAVLIKAAMILALFTGAVAAVNVMWAGPWSSRHQDEVLAEAKANPGMAALAQGQFQQASDGNAVMFIESVNGNRFHDVFLAQLRPKGNARPSVVVADSGELSQQKDGSQVVTLNKGTRFEGTAMLRDFRITDFNNYQHDAAGRGAFIHRRQDLFQCTIAEGRVQQYDVELLAAGGKIPRSFADIDAAAVEHAAGLAVTHDDVHRLAVLVQKHAARRAAA